MTPFPKRQFTPPAICPSDREAMPDESPTIFRATKRKANWRIEHPKDPMIFTQHQSLPVAISEMKKIVGGSVLVEF